jgi:hypothetical protein
LPHAVTSDSGTQPHTLLVHVPLSQLPQSTVLPQLSVVVPQRPLHQFACDWQTHVFWDPHVSPVGQSVGQARAWLQLSGPVPQCVLHQLGSDEHASAGGVEPASVAPSSPAAPSFRVASLPDPASGVAPPSPPSGTPVPPSPLVALVSVDPSTIGSPGSIPRMLPHAPHARDVAHTNAPSATRPKGKRSPILSTLHPARRRGNSAPARPA